MANFVTKKDGTRVPFDIEKIKHAVASSAMEAEISEEEAKKAADEVANSITATFDGIEEVSSTEIREKIMAELEATHPIVAESWRKYEEGKHE